MSGESKLLPFKHPGLPGSSTFRPVSSSLLTTPGLLPFARPPAHLLVSMIFHILFAAAKDVQALPHS